MQNIISELTGKLSECSPPVVLKGGKRSWEGIVWAVNSECDLGPVCGDKWDYINARVVCRQLGFTRGIPAEG